ACAGGGRARGLCGILAARRFERGAFHRDALAVRVGRALFLARTRLGLARRTLLGVAARGRGGERFGLGIAARFGPRAQLALRRLACAGAFGRTRLVLGARARGGFESRLGGALAPRGLARLPFGL